VLNEYGRRSSGLRKAVAVVFDYRKPMTTLNNFTPVHDPIRLPAPRQQGLIEGIDGIYLLLKPTMPANRMPPRTAYTTE
jgi:hypothetical protein